MVPKLLSIFALSKDSFELKKSRIARGGSGFWIVKQVRDNAGFLAIYITTELNRMIGRKRAEWVDSDWDNAEASLNQIEKYLIKVLEDFTKK